MSFSCILYPAVGSSCIQLLGSIVLLRWVQLYPFVGYKTVYEQAKGLLKRLCPEPVVAVVAVHVDATTVEGQAVRAVAVPWVST